MTSNGKITKLQFFFLIFQSQIGIAILSMPYSVYKKAQTDSWLSIIFAGVFIQLIILIQWFLARRFPSKNLFEIIMSLVGRKFGILVSLFYCIYFISVGGAILSLFSNVITDWLLPYTPQIIIKLLMISIGIYVVKENLRVISRFFVLSSIVLIFMIPLVLLSFKTENFIHLLPIGASGLLPIFNGIHQAILPLQGFEIFLVAFPYVSSNSFSKVKLISFSNLVSTLFYTLLTIACITFFSAQEMETTPQPVLYLIKSIGLKLIERPDIFFTALWIVSVSTSFMSYLYSTSKGFKSILPKFSRRIYVYIIACICLVVSLKWNERLEVNDLTNFILNLGLIFTIIIPFLLLITSLLFKKKEMSH